MALTICEAGAVAKEEVRTRHRAAVVVCSRAAALVSLLKEESSDLNAATCNSRLFLSILGFLDDGLQSSLKSGGVGVCRHGDGGGGRSMAVTSGGSSQRVAAAGEDGGQEKMAVALGAARGWRRGSGQ
jgi:hypothetical protein